MSVMIGDCKRQEQFLWKTENEGKELQLQIGWEY